MKVVTGAQIFINDKFFALADEVEIKYQDSKYNKSLIPDNAKLDPTQYTGTVIHIRRKQRTKDEISEVEKAKKEGSYDAFFQRMVNATDDPDAHIPIDTSDI